MAENSERMPCAFIGHGTPMNVIMDNVWTRTWQDLGQHLPRPRSILAVSAHWCTRGIGVTAMESPPTIHDFGGFPNRMYELRYPAPGDPALALRVRELLAPLPVIADQSWGLDHETWSVLCKAYPAANIPVVQLSLDMTRPPKLHFEIGARLAPLRDEGVLILGTGNVVHNLMLFDRGSDFAYDWARQFNDHIRDSLLSHRFDALVNYQALGDAAALSVPTPEHYYPLLYAACAAGEDSARIAVDGVTSGAMSMLSVTFGH
jgi:4,5-DOPA dioxygenase extradiol